jgi:hypothetical protein
MPSGVTHPIPVITTRRGRVNALNMQTYSLSVSLW